MAATDACPACGASTRYTRTPSTGLVPGRLADQVRECRRCLCLYTPGTASLYLGDSYLIVLPHMASTEPAEQRPYDLLTLGSKGLRRRHGWFDPQTKLITQVG